MILWNANKADTEFSRFIRTRDGRCMNPFCSNGLQRQAQITQLDCSHFWGRGVWLTRFDPDNCVALCRTCHEIWENDKQGKYRDLMIRLLGRRKFKRLEKRVSDYIHKNIPQITKSQMIKECRQFLTKKNANERITTII